MELQEGSLFHNRYKLLKNLGHGSFGEVWLAHDIKMKKDIAIKIYITLDEQGMEDFRIEIKNTYDISHPNLLHANHFDDCNGRPYLIMKYCSKGSAKTLLGCVHEVVVWQFIRDIANGLACLHNQNQPLIHQDIKPENILIDDNNHFLITDFGISKRIRHTLSQQSMRDLKSGTRAYMGPERFSEDPTPLKASDIWSLGVTIYEIMLDDLPFNGMGGGMMNSGAVIPKIRGNYSDELKETVRACLTKETWERPFAEELAEYADANLNGKSITPPWLVRLGKNNSENNNKNNATNNKQNKTNKDKSEETNNNISKKNYQKQSSTIDDSKIKKETRKETKSQSTSDNNQNKTYRENTPSNKLTPRWASNVTSEQKRILTELIKSMVPVEGGTFLMGAQKDNPNGFNYDINAYSRETPVHRVTLSDYFISKYQITIEQWQAVIGYVADCNFKDCHKPIDNISWHNCQDFVNKLNKMTGLTFALPTEAQWEFAARGGNKSRGYKYSGSDDWTNVAWYYSNSKGKTHPVGHKQENELGLYDMSGNVWEWCQDAWHSYDCEDKTNPKYNGEKDSYRIIRGGNYLSDANSKSCRISYRGDNEPNTIENGLGLRLVINKNSGTKGCCLLLLLIIAIILGIISFFIFNDNNDNHTPDDINNSIVDSIDNNYIVDAVIFDKAEKMTIPNDFVLIESGTLLKYNDFYNNQDNYKNITVEAFYISKYELTQKEYKRVMGTISDENCTFEHVNGDTGEKINNIFLTGDSIPFIGSIIDFVNYCNTRSKNEGYIGFYTIDNDYIYINPEGNGYRIPTEVEWIYAARCGNQQEKYRYSGSNKITDVAWYSGNSKHHPHEVGLLKPNGKDLYDMSGNINELVWSKCNWSEAGLVTWLDYDGWVGTIDDFVLCSGLGKTGVRIILITEKNRNLNINVHSKRMKWPLKSN